MKLETSTVKPGDWIVIAGAAPASTDLTPQLVKLNDKEIAAYVDGKDLLLRCPDFKDRSTIDVSIRGITLGRIEISR